MSRLSASRRFFLRSRVCRAAIWLLALCFALDGALLAAKPLPVAAAKVAAAACHHVASHSQAGAGHVAPDCCHGGCDCACAGAPVFGEVARLSFTTSTPLAREAVRVSTDAVALRAAVPPLRPPIA